MTSMSSLDPSYQLMQPGTPTKASSFPGDPTMNHPYYLTPGTSTEIILNHSSATANMTGPCARNTMTYSDPPGQFLSSTIPEAVPAALHNIRSPPTRNQTHAGIILCLPAQQNRANTSNSKSIRKKPKPTHLASSSQVTDSRARALKPESNIPTRPKELTRDETRQMLMDKARTEVIRYLDD